jgi:hypothetical protein
MNGSLSPKRATATGLLRPRRRDRAEAPARLDEGLQCFRALWIAIPLAVLLWVAIAVAVLLAFSAL